MLRQVISEALQPFTVPTQLASTIGEIVRISSKTALALSVVFNELGTNALKYGALSNAEGMVRIAWNILEARGDRTPHLKMGGGRGPLGEASVAQGLRLECDRARTYP